MHRHFQAERARLEAEVNARIEALMARLYRAVDNEEAGLGEVQDGMTAALATRQLVRNLSTWPWQAETPRWLISALLIPLAIWGSRACWSAPGCSPDLRRAAVCSALGASALDRRTSSWGAPS
jgi:hypothetical protein